MKFFISTVVLAAMMAGCASSAPKKPDASAASPLDVGPSAVAMTYTPPAPQPVMVEPLAPVAPVAAVSGGSYTIRKGDTLYKIARDRYGDGKQWQKIAMANPGVTPQGLKVGQTIVVP